MGAALRIQGAEDGLSSRNFEALARYIYDYSGIKMPITKMTMLEGRLRRRLGHLGAPPGEIDGDYQKLWTALGHDPTGMDQLVERTGLTPAELSSMLLLMELDGRVTAQHGRYHRSR